MNKYTGLSDFEINKKVAERLFLKFSDCSSVILVDGETFDPCNNPADAMPIIIENKIAMNHPYDIWQCGSGWNVAENKNPLRACMEAFLMKKDAENE